MTTQHNPLDQDNIIASLLQEYAEVFEWYQYTRTIARVGDELILLRRYNKDQLFYDGRRDAIIWKYGQKECESVEIYCMSEYDYSLSTRDNMVNSKVLHFYAEMTFEI